MPRARKKVKSAPRGTKASRRQSSTQSELINERRTSRARERTRNRQLADEIAGRSRAENRVQTLALRLVTIQEEERRRLSRELHDELGQQLTALRLILSVLRGVADKEEMQQHLDSADRIASRLDRDVDRLAWALSPPSLDEFGLVAALDTFVRQWSEQHGISANLTAFEMTPRLPRDTENHLYRVVQEALNNVVKHAQATRAGITLSRSDHQLRLVIQDNDRGFDPAAVRGQTGLGLPGLRERVALLGGHIDVESSMKRGTTITVRVPIVDPAT